MNKKIYITPTAHLTIFGELDIITSSGGFDGEDDLFVAGPGGFDADVDSLR